MQHRLEPRQVEVRRSSRSGSERTRLAESGAARKPSAEAAPEAGGTTSSRTPERARDLAGVGGPGAAEAHHGVAARVLAALDQIDARGVGHALDDHLVDAPGGLLDRQAERGGDAGDRRRARPAASSAMVPPRKKPGS